MNREIRLGLLFLIGLVVVGFVTLTVSHWTPPWRHAFTLTVYFDNVEGLKPGDAVRVSGVQYGRVQSVDLDGKKVKVDLVLDREPPLREGYKILIQESALIGGRYVEITLGDAEKPPANLREPLTGEALPSPFQELSQILQENRKDLRETMENVKEITHAVREGPGLLHDLITDKALFEKIDKIAGNLESVSDKLNTGAGTLGKLVNDPTLYDDLKTVAADLKAMTGRIQQGPGLVHDILYDPELSKDVRQAAEELRGTVASARDILEKVQSGEKPLLAYAVDEQTYKNAEQAIQDFGKVVGRAARIEFWLGGDVKRYPDSDLTISRLFLRLQPGDDKYFQVGAAFLSLGTGGDVDSREKIESDDSDLLVKGEVQLAYRLGFITPALEPAWLRVGLLEGKPGGAIDVEWKDSPLFGSDLTFTLEGRDAYGSVDSEKIDEQVRGPLVRSYVTARIWKGFKAYAGASRIGNTPELMLGGSFEYNDEDLRSLVAVIGLGK